MLISFITLLLPLALPPPNPLAAAQAAPAQTRIVAIYRPSLPPSQNPVIVLSDHPISDATNHPNLQPGDIIFISCGYGDNGSGYPVVVSFGSDETWPIRIKPGVSIREYINPTYNAPAMITATAANPPAAGTPLIQFVDAPSGWNATDPTAELIGVDVVGGDIGVLVKSDLGGPVDALLDNVVFSRNRVGLQVEATHSHTLPVIVRDCSTSSNFSPIFHAPDLKPFEVGIRFWALLGTPGEHSQVDAELTNYQTSGEYPSALMNPIAKLAGSTEPCDLAEYTPAAGGPGTFTRIVEVGTRGDLNRVEYLEPPNSTKQDVCSVTLAVNGGVLDGNASAGSSSGWDVGIYAVADIPDQAPGDIYNYTSWFDVATSGTIVENCRASGIYVQTNTGTRGHLTMNNQTIVRQTGIQLASTTHDALYTGIHAVAKRSYLTVRGDTMMTRDNAGNGIFCYSPGNSITPVPMGLFLGLKKVGIHDNGRCGLRVESAISHGGGGTFGRVSGAVVGGTQVSVSSNVSLSNTSSTPLIGDFPLQGQGYLNRCVITGGGDGTYGLFFKVRGNSGLFTADHGADFSAIALRAVNTYVWDFAGGGIYAELEQHMVDESGPTLLTPVVHCTVVDNPAFSIDIKEFLNPTCRYYRLDPTGEYLNTMLAHSIFDTRSANPDFGSNLDPATGGANWEYDNGQGWHATNLDRPHLASIRANLAFHPLSGWGTTADPVAYEGTPAGLNPNQWFLDFAAASTGLKTVANYLNAGGDLSEDAADIEAFQRNPMPTILRNKGGEEDQ